MAVMDGSPGPRELVALLAEPDRLRALAAVVLGAGTLPEVSERTGMEPRAAARALSRLVAGGLLDGGTGGGYRVRTEALRAAHGKRLVVLDHLACLFEPGRRYPEPEVNELLKRFHDDYAMLRRYLVDDGFLDRADEPAPSGSRSVKVYWRTGGSVALGPPTSA
jgi:hypothetical protein